jgi:ribose 1,5-bisphosphate isomerase
VSPTAVVTVFLRHAEKVALVKRSQRVGTYQGLFSGISGYLEGDPDQHFRVEIAEETSLTADDFTLLRKAEPVAITDAGQGRQWRVHPYLCEVHNPSRIRLDWENTELVWILPQDIARLPCVPGLWDVYVQVSELVIEQSIAEFARHLASDETSGARQLALDALDFLARLCRESTAASPDMLSHDILTAIEHLGRVRPSMTVINTSLSLVFQDIPAYTVIDDARVGILRIIARHQQAMEMAVGQAVAHLAEIVPEGACLLLHSYSSTVAQALGLLKRKGCRVIVTESRPGLEGRRTASLCTQAGLTVRLITDAAIYANMQEVQMVLLGADAILSGGHAINKMGSSAIACCAHALGVPLFILAERRKLVPGDQVPCLEQGPADAVWETPPDGVLIENNIFELIPPAYIRGIILEDGVFEPGRIG